MTRVARRLGWLTAALAMLTLAAFAPARAADQAAAKKRELKAVKAQIAQVKKTLDQSVARHDTLAAKLRETEQALGEANAALRKVERSLAMGQDKLARLKKKEAGEQRKLNQEKRSLAAQIRGAYIAGRGNRLKLMLNQEDPARVQRMLGYYDYFNRARARRIGAFNARLERLARLADAINAQLERLASLKARRQQTVATIKQQHAARQAVLAQVESAIDSHQTRLAKLKRNKQRLEELVRKLTQALADIPDNLDSRSFASLKGKLPWPVAGPHLASYGSRREDGHLKWRGILIGGTAGAPVRAIAHGRVVYAGWLPHFGLLLIIDHGDNYLSLYAHNQSLYKQVGNWVGAGETVAALGASGGRAKPALYFEIRRGETPVNPAHWCVQR